MAADVVLRGAIVEFSGVLKNQLSLALGHEDSLSLGVILMGDAIMQGFQDNLLIVFGDLHRNELSGRKKGESEISDPLIEP